MQHLTKIRQFVLLALLQALVLNHVRLGQFAAPILYIYFVMKFSSGTGTKALTLWAFAIGLCIDILSNTPGLNAASCTFAAFCRPVMLRLFSARDPRDDFEPGIRVMGFAQFFRYALALTLLHCAALNLIDAFSFANPGTLALKTLGDTTATLVCVLCIDSVRRGK